MRERAAAKCADIILTPEMFLAGYPADDLVLRADFMDRIEAAISRLAKATADGGPAIIVLAKMTKKKTYENICKNYENAKRQKPYKTCRFLTFSVEKTRFQRRFWDARALTSRNRFSFKNLYKS